MPVCPRLAALAVTIRDDEVLLVRRRNPPDAGLWGFPGGHVELGETALQAAARELAEETGVIAAPRRYIENVDMIRHGSDGALQHHFLLAAVLCDYLDGQPTAADDAFEAGWYPVEHVLAGNLPLSDQVAAVLRRALEVMQQEA
ncbi:NUDIX hydrolase [Paracoccus onubensis]|uniref:NUDIX domain-containing protein n=1 Tax=Paracoccus onubensis TaxID=1675788 RepID=A0A418SMW2_9RHOB|nr:NUDIX hydrolase [Paracoccus onubensis]RJE82291.1 NUDIX domain-containing protein [Paracoccus onubensis]